jgi:hypothetical protein
VELNRTLRRIEASYSDQAHRIWDVWESAVGDPLCSRCRPLHYRNGTLVLAVSSTSWMQQIQFLTGTIRDTLNCALGEDLIRQVRLRVGEAPPPAPPEAPAPFPPTSQLPTLPDSAKEAMERELAKIPDAEVRQAVRRARSRAARLALLKEDPTD